MKYFNVLATNTKGFVKAYEAGLKWRSMRNKEEVKRRVDALRFWEVHGLAAAIDHSGVSKRTLQRWKAILKQSDGIDGKKRYIITAIDVTRRVAYAQAYTSHSSATARGFLKKLLSIVPFEIVEI